MLRARPEILTAGSLTKAKKCLWFRGLLITHLYRLKAFQELLKDPGREGKVFLHAESLRDS